MNAGRKRKCFGKTWVVGLAVWSLSDQEWERCWQASEPWDKWVNDPDRAAREGVPKPAELDGPAS